MPARPPDPLALDPVVVTGVGLASSLGALDQAAAAFRAGLVRLGEVEGLTYVTDGNEVEAVHGHVAPGLNHGYRGAARLAHLARAAARDLGETPGAVALSLVLPESAAGFAEGHRQTLTAAVARAVGAEARLVEVRFGRTGFAASLGRAFLALAADPSQVAVVGAVDSLVDPERVEALAEVGRLARADQADGLTPGEGACFVRVERLSRARHRGAPVLARLAGPTVEDGLSDDRAGAGLASAVRHALAASGGSGPASLYVDANGETARAKDLGHALMRLSADVDLDRWRIVTPGVGFGDTGVVGSPLAVGLAVRAAARGYGVGGPAVVATTSDEDGAASAVAVLPS